MDGGFCGWGAGGDEDGELAKVGGCLADGPGGAVGAGGGWGGEVNGDGHLTAGGGGRDGGGGRAFHSVTADKGELEVVPIAGAGVTDAPGFDEGGSGIKVGAVGDGDVGDVGG